MSTFTPSDARETAETVAWAAAEGRALEIVAGGTKRGLGRPMTTEHVLDVSRLAGVVTYEPAELVLTVRPGERLAAIAAALEAEGQMLAFEPPDWRQLLGSSGEQTLGGIVACNLSGPRRLRAGAARDFVLGFSAVNGFGETWKAGGKVVKNVTGYDMAKLQAGAYGTLSVLTEITVKTTPRPATSCTLALAGLDDEAAIAALARGLNSPFEVTGAAHLPARSARRSGVGAVAGGAAAVTLLRLEGPPASVAWRADALEALLGRAVRLGDAETRAVWRELGAVAPLLGPGRRVVWRLCPTPSRAASLAGACRAAFDSAEVFYDWGGGLVWLALDQAEAADDGGAARVRAAIAGMGGHATLIAAPDSIRAATPVFQPEERGVALLGARVKRGFDPRAILNPGRLREGL
ncbi:glycolate oxidase FAD binding subunit [Roseiarcus fermentans]|uniref:Glycolate oxidase FAD binding subunit n=1 Tax=Roseiarcus fermentans TaxID=1473586 RepID=A0A366FRK4_9HYPH|nr:FAD-binding protein [Roseiarcus fermentans]RBP17171.1 glycolate oxidase FAD binding subunit [Roseiarcus fermentans]